MTTPRIPRHTLLASCLAWAALAAFGPAAAQPAAPSAADTQLDCAQLQAELTALAASQPAAADNPAAAAAGAQVLGALAQQAAARSGRTGSGLGSMLGGLMGGSAPVAAPAGQGNVANVLQLVQVAQAVQGAPAADPTQRQAEAQAQAAAVAQVATLQALAQQRGVAGMGRSQAEAVGVVSMLGGLLSAAQAAQPVATPGNAALQQLAGSRQEQLAGLYLAKGCKAPS